MYTKWSYTVTTIRNLINQIKISPSPAKQFSLRLEYELAIELEQCAKDMNTTNTAISRMAIKKLLAELKKSGAREYMRDLLI
jgi:hypothetical protein